MKQSLIKASRINYGLIMFMVWSSMLVTTNIYFTLLFVSSLWIAPLYHFVRLKKSSPKVSFYDTYLERGQEKIYFEDMTRHQFLKMRNGNYQLEFRAKKNYYCFTFSQMGMDLIKPLLKKY